MMDRRANRSYFFVMVLLCLGFGLQAAGGDVIYVDDSATELNNGSSWANAYVNLQDALTAATYDDEVRVGQGAYKPTMGTDRAVSFQLVNGVILRGGYAGVGVADPNAHDVAQYQTILSGDLNGDDVPGFTNYGDNSYHVVNGSGMDQTAVIEGFTITGGSADGINPHNSGGGMFNESGNPTVINCTFRGNRADSTSGGMLNLNNSNPKVTNCIFSGNWAHNRGGGMCNNAASNPILTNCTFSGNSSGLPGGGIRNYDSDPNLINCIIWGNTPTSDQVLDEGTSSAVVTYSDIQGGSGESWFGV
ncbi:MAG: right-handed parallel beta-helix repeat-containing protein, partial [Planctomycetes bacterium]|nr:right-handed parallel beta-helix repeat-containing protein [Planctomycetota bacterium]